MGSVSLVCPMCCGETFDNSQSLKYHLLSMTDNLYCPNCAERSDSVGALIQHLDCCGDNRDLINIYPSKEYKSTSGNVQSDDAHCGFLATVSEDGGIVMVGDNCNLDETKEQDNTDIHTAMSNHDGVLEFPSEKEEEILGICDKDNWSKIKEEKNSNGIAEEHLELASENNMEVGNPLEMSSFEEVSREDPNESELVQVKEEMPEVESDALYSCSSCDMSFNSILSHIQEYHDGQEVVLEMAEQQMDDFSGETELEDHKENKETLENLGMKNEVFSEENSSADSSRPLGNSSGSVPRQRRTMNTLRTEECVDSEGRLYTRKVVQIERFWDRGSEGGAGSQSHSQQRQSQNSSKSASMIEKFFSNAEGLKIRTKSPKTINVVSTTTTTVTTPTTAPTTTTSTATSTTDGTATSSSQATAPLTIRMYRCNKCLEQFVKLADFRVHACIHGNNQCDLCEQAFASAKALQLHSRIHEAEAEDGNDSNFVCQTCGTEFASHKSLRLHSRMHAPVRARHVDAPEGTATENFTCTECGKTLSESYRKAHMALHKGDSVTCSVCNRKFDSADSLAMHAAVHVEFAQSQQQQQQQHKQDVAQQLLEDQKIEDESNGGKRMKIGKEGDKSGGAGDAPEKPYQCQHCGRRFTRPHEKVKHERIHTGEKPHACEVCGKTFRVSYCLTLHMRTHTGVRPYACQHCGKRFKASSVYNHHLLTHGEERAYTCPYCPKTFKTRVQLAGHKNSHTKPFRCTECSRPFASLYAARAHIQTHKKDNNLKFSCYICGASYGRAFALKDHLKQHTGQDAVVPPPEPAREEEVIDADEFIISAEAEEYEEIEEIEEIEEEEHKLVEVAAAAAAGHVGVPRSNFIDCNNQSEL